MVKEIQRIDRAVVRERDSCIKRNDGE